MYKVLEGNKIVKLIAAFVLFVQLLSGTCLQAIGGNKIDSLEQRLKSLTKPDTARVNTLNELAWELQSSDPLKGIELAMEAKEISEKLGFRLGVGKSLLSIGVNYYIKSENKKALELYQQSLKIFEEVEDLDSKATALLNIGNIYFYEGDHSGALNYYNKALVVLEEKGDKSRAASVYGNIGNVYFFQGNYPKSLEYQFKSFQISQKAGNLKVQGNSLLGIANIYFKMADYPKSLEYYYKSLQIFETSGNKKAQASAYGGIGTVFLRQFEYNKALDNFNKSLKISDEIGDEKNCAITFTNIGNVYSSNNNYKKALENHIQAYKLFEDIGSKPGMASALSNIGQTNMELHNFQEAIDYYQKAYDLNTSIGNQSGVVSNLKGLSTVYLRLVKDTIKAASGENKPRFIMDRTKALNNSVKYALMSLEISKEINEIDQQQSAYKNLSEAYQLLNEWKKAFFYADSAYFLQDSIYSLENQRKITDIEQKRINELMEKEIELIQVSLKHQRIAIGAISIGFLLLVVIVIMIYRSLRNKRRLNKWLEEEVRKQTAELVTANEKLEKANKELVALEESKAEFLKLISHEIRTPLNGIIGFTYLLKEELKSSDFAAIINNLDKSVLRLERFSIAALLITELRSKPESLNFHSRVVSKLIDQTRARNEKQLESKNLRLSLKDEASHMSILGDEELLGMSLDIVLDNAINYSPFEGEITMYCFQEDDWIVLEIKDQGRGFSRDALEHLYQLFAVGEGHLDNHAGLSLALVKLVMDAHHGHIEAGNNTGGGAFVRLSLPVRLSE